MGKDWSVTGYDFYVSEYDDKIIISIDRECGHHHRTIILPKTPCPTCKVEEK